MQENEAACEIDTGKDVRYVYHYGLPQIFLEFWPDVSSLQAIQMLVFWSENVKFSCFFFFFFVTLANVIKIEGRVVLD